MEKEQQNEISRQAWEANAEHWDSYMGETGNDFVNLLIWPASSRLLAIQPGERVLDVACGNGLYSIRLAELGAEVVGFDFSTGLINRARARAASLANRPDYRVLDATDLKSLLALGLERFDAALCNMALFDMADLGPLAKGLARLIKPGGRFVFSVMHPCFNGLHATFLTETSDDGDEVRTRYFLKLSRYLTPFTGNGLGFREQPEPQPYFHRPLHELLRPFFLEGFIIDTLEEKAFPLEHEREKKTSWSGNYNEFPPVLVIRMRVG